MDAIFSRRDAYNSDDNTPNASRDGDEDNEDAPNTQEDKVLSRLQGLVKEEGRKRKVVRKQVKLDVDRLKSSRGLPALTHMAKHLRFRGKGHEVSDLQALMECMAHWGHRLVPSMPFQQLVERLEVLGSKKEVQTLLKRVRLDLPILDSDIVYQEEENDEGADWAMENNNHQFPELIKNNIDKYSNNNNNVNNNNTNDINSNSIDIDHIDDVMVAASTSSSIEASLPQDELLQAQRERMQRNRELALQRRANKMKK